MHRMCTLSRSRLPARTAHIVLPVTSPGTADTPRAESGMRYQVSSSPDSEHEACLFVTAVPLIAAMPLLGTGQLAFAPGGCSAKHGSATGYLLTLDVPNEFLSIRSSRSNRQKRLNVRGPRAGPASFTHRYIVLASGAAGQPVEGLDAAAPPGHP